MAKTTKKSNRVLGLRQLDFRSKDCALSEGRIAKSGKKNKQNLNSFAGNQRGSIAVYAAVFSVLGLGAGAIAVDYGRVIVLKSQMQNRADAAALSAVLYLDGSSGAVDRATEVARHSVTQTSAQTVDNYELAVVAPDPKFFEIDGVTSTNVDQNARYVSVTLEKRKINFLFRPMLTMLIGSNGKEYAYISATAVARSDSFLCNAPPLMVCDPGEVVTEKSLGSKLNVGKQYRLKEPQTGGGTWAPGNFGLLATPDGSSGADAIASALKQVAPTGCYALDVLTTATGSMTNKIKDGINSRFDLPLGEPNPAPNVINYPRDAYIITDLNENFGDGNWDLLTYWTDKHGASPPADVTTRYQAYLYELGVEFAVKGKETFYPIVPLSLPGGTITVTPWAADVPVSAVDPNNNDLDGVPSVAPASNGHARRLVQVAILQCVVDDIKGSGTYPTHGQFAEMFITETVKDPPDAAIYGEFVRMLTPSSSLQYHSNARLIK